MARKRYLLMWALAAVLVSAVSVVGADDLAAQEKMAERLCIKKQFAQAEQVYQGMLDQAGDPEKRFGAARKLAAVLTAQDDKQPAAKAAIAGILTDYADHARLPHAIHEIAENCHKFGKAKEAKGLYRQILEEQPERPDAIWLVMGQAIADTFAGDEDAAWVNTERLLNDYPDDSRAAEAVGQVAWCCRKVEDWENARTLYQHVVDTWPDNERAIYSQRGIILASLKLGDFDAADAATEGFIRHYAEHQDFVEVLATVAEGHKNRQRFETARELHQHIADQYPESDQAIWSQREAILGSIGLRDPQARNAGIAKLLEKFSKHPRVGEAAYQVARKLNWADRAKAGELYEFVTQKERNGRFGLLAQANLANHRLLNGDAQGAEALFAELWDRHKADPGFIEVATIMAEGCWHAMAVARGEQSAQEYQKSADRCLAMWQRIIDELPETEFHTAEAHFFAGECYWQRGQYPEAIEKYETVVERWPDFMHAGRAQLSIIRSIERMIQLQQVPKARAVQRVRQACRKLIADYPDYRGVGIAEATLKKWEPYEAAQKTMIKRYRAWSEQ